MGIVFKGNPPIFSGSLKVEAPTPTYSGKKSSNTTDSINPYTSQGPGEGGIGMTTDEIISERLGSDPLFEFVSLLLHFDGTNGSTSFIDSSNNNLTPTVSGTSQLTTGDKRFGTASGLWPSGVDISNYIRWPNQAPAILGSGSFTVECWIKLSSFSVGGNNHQVIFSSGRGIADDQITFSVVGSNLRMNYSSSGQLDVAHGMSLNVWNHFAYSYRSSPAAGNMYINGNRINANTISLIGGRTSASTVYVSKHQFTSANFYTIPHMDELRVTKYPRYLDSSFELQTEPHPDF